MADSPPREATEEGSGEGRKGHVRKGLGTLGTGQQEDETERQVGLAPGGIDFSLQRALPEEADQPSQWAAA